MATHLIHPEAIRCVNHRCSLRTNCRRYLQLAIDKQEKAVGRKVSRFGDVDTTIKCHHQEPMNYEIR